MRNFIFLCLVVVLSTFLVSAQDRTVLSAKVVRQNNGQPVAYVNIVNKTYNKGTAANAEGQFQMPVRAGDTLLFSAIGYANLQVVLSSQNIGVQLFAMKALHYELGEITVYGYNFDKTDIRKPRSARQGIPLSGIKSSSSSFSPYQPGFQNVISLLYSEFSRRERLKREGWNFIGRLEMLKVLDTLFKERTVSALIPFQNQELEMFKRYCILDPSFFLSGNDYLNLVALKRKVRAYLFYQDRNSR